MNKKLLIIMMLSLVFIGGSVSVFAECKYAGNGLMDTNYQTYLCDESDILKAGIVPIPDGNNLPHIWIDGKQLPVKVEEYNGKKNILKVWIEEHGKFLTLKTNVIGEFNTPVGIVHEEEGNIYYYYAPNLRLSWHAAVHSLKFDFGGWKNVGELRSENTKDNFLLDFGGYKEYYFKVQDIRIGDFNGDETNLYYSFTTKKNMGPWINEINFENNDITLGKIGNAVFSSCISDPRIFDFDDDWANRGEVISKLKKLFPTEEDPDEEEDAEEANNRRERTDALIKAINDNLPKGDSMTNLIFKYNTPYEDVKLKLVDNKGITHEFAVKIDSGAQITDKLENLQEGQCTLKMRLTAPNVDLNPENFESYGGANDNLSVNLPSDEILEKKFYIKNTDYTKKSFDYEIVTPKTSHIYCIGNGTQNKVQIPIVIVPRSNQDRYFPQGSFYSKSDIINEFTFSYSLENRNNDFFSDNLDSSGKISNPILLNYGKIKGSDIGTYYTYLEISNYALPEGREKEEITLNTFYEDQQEQVKFHIGKCDAETAFTQKWENFLNRINGYSTSSTPNQNTNSGGGSSTTGGADVENPNLVVP